MTAVYAALFGVAAANWREGTGVALRLDVLSRHASVVLAIAVPGLLLGPAFVFRVTREPLWLFAASIVGATVSVACHLQFVRLHRKAS